MHLISNSEVYLTWTFKIYVLMLKIRIILHVDFLNWCTYFQTQKYTWIRLSKLMYLCSNSEVYLKYTSFHKKSRSINEVLLKYKQSTSLFFSAFILYLYFFLGSSFKVYFYWTSRIWSINAVYLKYTSYIVFL